MIGDDPVFIAVVVAALAGWMWVRFRRQSSDKRCPQCFTFVLGLAGSGGQPFECRRCATRLVREADGSIRRAPAS